MQTSSSRRTFFRQAVAAGLFFATPGLFAEALTLTPAQTEGPFYPDKLPLDTDNDLILVNNQLTPAAGEITWLYGTVRDQGGQPLRNTLVEIWQCDARGVYIHTGNMGGHEKQDKNFQGYGRFLTGATGEYVFRTIKPVAYPGRTPHIHCKVSRAGKEVLTTQCYIRDNPANAKDGVWKGIRDARARESVTVAFTPLKDSSAGELTAHFDLTLGLTPKG